MRDIRVGPLSREYVTVRPESNDDVRRPAGEIGVVALVEAVDGVHRSEDFRRRKKASSSRCLLEFAKKTPRQINRPTALAIDGDALSKDAEPRLLKSAGTLDLDPSLSYEGSLLFVIYSNCHPF